jgi:hypothetical protein
VTVGASVPDLVEKGEPTEKFVQALEEVINFKREYGTTDSGAFSLDGFVTFYVEQTIDDAEETWKDLTKLGYNKKLERSEK